MHTKSQFAVLRIILLLLMLVAFCASIFFCLCGSRFSSETQNISATQGTQDGAVLSSLEQSSSQNSTNKTSNQSTQTTPASTSSASSNNSASADTPGDISSASTGDDVAEGKGKTIRFYVYVASGNVAEIKVGVHYREEYLLGGAVNRWYTADVTKNSSWDTALTWYKTDQDFIGDLYFYYIRPANGYYFDHIRYGKDSNVNSSGNHDYTGSISADTSNQSTVNIDTDDEANIYLWIYTSPIKYTIQFNPNGGSGSMSNMVISGPASQNLSYGTFTKTNYSFCGWGTSANGTRKYKDGASFTPSSFDTTDDKSKSTKTITLYAMWANVVTLNYNGGADSDGNENYTFYHFVSSFYSDSRCTNLIKPTIVNNDEYEYRGYYQFPKPTHAGYNKFDGFYLNDDTQYINSDAQMLFCYSDGGGENIWLPDFDGSTVLYAKYSDPKTFTLTLDANGGSYAGTTVSATNTTLTNNNDGTYGIVYGENVEVTVNYSFSRTGYLLNGNTPVVLSPSVGDISTSGNSISFTLPTNNLTLTAQWTPITYKVQFDGNGGTVAGSSVYTATLTYDAVFTFPTNVVRNNYYFAGWNENQTNANNYIVAYENNYTKSANKNWSTTQDATAKTLYAVWYPLYNIYASSNTMGSDNKLTGYTVSNTGGTFTVKLPSGSISKDGTQVLSAETTFENQTQLSFYVPASSLTVTPSASSASHTFKGWSNNCDGNATYTTNNTLSGPNNWYAVFCLNSFSVTASVNNSNYGSIVASAYNNGSVNGSEFYYGSSVVITVTETANVGHFDNLKQGTTQVSTTGSGPYTNTFTITSATSFTATFIPYWNSNVLDVSISKTYEYTRQPITPALGDISIINTKDGNKEVTSGYAINSVGSNTDVGTATLTIKYTGTDFYTNSGNLYVTATFQITPYDLSAHVGDLTYTLSADFTYDGQEKKATISAFTASGYDMVVGVNYNLSYPGNITNASARDSSGNYKKDKIVRIAGTGNYTGTVDVGYTIYARDISNATVSYTSAYFYTGLPLNPNNLKDLVLTYNSTLTKGTDYTVQSVSRTNVGTLSFNIYGTNTGANGTGNYTGFITKNLTIQKLSLSNQNVTMTINWTNGNSFLYTGGAITPTESNAFGISTADGSTSATTSKIGSVKLSFNSTAFGSYPFASNVDLNTYLYTLAVNTEYYTSYANNTNVGTATITINGNGDNFEGQNSDTFEITKRKITANILALAQHVVVYNGADQAPTFAISNFPVRIKANTSDASVVDVTITCTVGQSTSQYYTSTDPKWQGAVNFINAQTYTIQVVATADGNYQGNYTLEYTIQKFTLDGITFSVTQSSVVYDGTTHYPEFEIGNSVLDVSQYQINYTYISTVDSSLNVTQKDVYSQSGAGTTRHTIVGKFTFYFVLTDTTNFELSGTVEPVTFEITPFDITGKMLSYTVSGYVFDGEAHTPTPTITCDGMQITYTINSYSNNTNAGTATASITANRNFKGTNSFTFTINPKAITEAGFALVKQVVEYNGTEQRPTFVKTDDNFTTNDYTLTYSSQDFTHSGTIQITVTGKNNYFGTLNFTYEIKQANVVDVDYNFEYNDWSGTTQTHTSYAGKTVSKYYVGMAYTITGFQITTEMGTKITVDTNGLDNAGNSFVINKTSNDFTNAGSTTITFTLDESSIYHDFVFNNSNGNMTCEFVILQVSLTSLASTDFPKGVAGVGGKYTINAIADQEYTGKEIEPNVRFSSSYANLANALNTAGNITLSYQNNINVGTATITITGNNNFTGTTSKTFKVIPFEFSDATATIVFDDGYEGTDITYDAEEHKPSVNSIKFTDKLGATVVFVVSESNISFAGGNFVDVGTYTVTVTINGNYKGTATKTYKIVAKELKNSYIQWGTTSFVYDGEDHLPTITIVDNDITNTERKNITSLFTITYKDTNNNVATEFKNVGAIKVSVVQNDGTNYYIQNTVSGITYNYYLQDYTITARNLSSQIDDKTVAWPELVYNGATHSPTVDSFVVSFAGNTKTLTLNLGTDYTCTFVYSGDGVSAGSVYTLSISGKGNFGGGFSNELYVKQRNLNSSGITIVVHEKGYTGQAQAPTATITDSGLATESVVLVENTSYTIKLDEEKHTEAKNIGKYYVVISGIGNYTGVLAGEDYYFLITQVHINDNYTVEFTLDFSTVTFDGYEHKPFVSRIAVYAVGETTEYVGYTPDTSEISYVYDGSDLTDAQKFVYVGTYKIVFTPNSNSIFIIDSGFESMCQTTYQITKKDINSFASGNNFKLSYTSREFNATDNKPTLTTPTMGLNGTYVLTQGTDFAVAYLRNGLVTTDYINCGTIDVNIDANSSRNFTGEIVLQYEITPRSISDVAITRASLDTLYYTGSVVEPAVASVTDSELGYTLTSSDYTLSYVASDKKNPAINAGQCYIVVTGKGNYKDMAELMFVIEKAIISGVTLKNSSGEYTRNVHTIDVDVVTTQSGATITNTDYTVYYRESDDFLSATSSLTNVGNVYVFVVANTDSQNFTGTVYTIYTITPAKITTIELTKSQVTYNTLSQKDNIVASVVKTAGGITLYPSEYTLTYWRGTTQLDTTTGDFANNGTITVKVHTSSTNFADQDPLVYALFDINKKSLETENIEVKYYYVDAEGNPKLDTEGNKIYLVTDQVYKGEAVAPEVKYYYLGTNQQDVFVTLVVNYDYTFTHVPSDWESATEKMALTLTAVETSNYTGVVLMYYSINPAPWTSDHITITITSQVYTGRAITFDPTSTPNGVITAVYDKGDGSEPVTLIFGEDFEVASDFNDANNNIVDGYSNNLNANTGALVVFRATNPNYDPDDTIGVSFTILPRNLNDTSNGDFVLDLDNSMFTYTGSKQTPALNNPKYNYTYQSTVYPVLMEENTDYTISFALSSDDENNIVEPINAGNYKAVVNGVNNFTGTKNLYFVINQKSLADSDIVFSISDNTVYRVGVSQKPIYDVTYLVGDKTITLTSSDFVLTTEYADFLNNTFASIAGNDTDFVNAGVYKLTATAVKNGNYMGFKNVEYTINQDTISEILLTQTTMVYNGVDQKPGYTVNAEENKGLIFESDNESDLQVQIIFKQWQNENWVTTTTPNFRDVGKVQIIVVAKDTKNFVGEVFEVFEITPKALNSQNITVEANGFVYNMAEQRAIVTVVDTVSGANVTLVENTDYTLTYLNNINAGFNTASVKVEGVGNYKNSVSYSYSISACNLSSLTLDSSAISSLVYTGSTLSLTQSLIAGLLVHVNGDLSYTLVLDTDFAIAYDDTTGRKNVGDYTFNLSGKGNYTGTLSGSELKFTIEPQDITNNGFICISSIDDQTYTGEEITPNVTVWDSNISTRDLNAIDTNYTVEYINNVNVHWTDGIVDAYAQVVVNGIYNYKGTKIAYFKILPLDINSNLVVKTPSSLKAQHYTGQPVCPQPVLTFNEQTVSVFYNYANNIEITTDDENLASVIITATAGTNFKGTITIYFRISSRDLSWVTVYGIADVTYNNAVQKLVPTLVYATDTESDTLVEGEDYELEYQNLYDDFENVGHIKIVVTGLTYSGSLVLEYDIVPVTINQTLVGSTLFVEGLQTLKFDGTAKEQQKTNIQVKIKFDNTIVIPQDCYTLSYANNTNAGQAEISFVFDKFVGESGGVLNNYLGSFVANFEITKKILEQSMFVGFTGGLESEYEYKGSAIQPTLTLMYNGFAYSAQSGGFAVAFENNTNVVRRFNSATNKYDVVRNEAFVMITANDTSNFMGTITIYFTIVPRVAVMSNFDTQLSQTEFYYDSTEHCPEFTKFNDIIFGGDLELGVDYVIKTYQNNTNASIAGNNAGIVVEFIKNYDGTLTFEFVIKPRNITELTITPERLSDVNFDGNEHKAEVTLKFRDGNDILHTLVENADYTLQYTRDDGISGTDVFVHAGTITLNILAQGNYDGLISLSYNINKVAFGDVLWSLTTDSTAYTFKNAQITPELSAVYNGFSFQLDKDFVVTYGTNTNVADGGTVVVTVDEGSNITQGTKTFNFDITPRQIALASFDIGAQTEFVYTGQEILPSTITLRDEALGLDLILGIDYLLSNTANIMPGQVTITALGKGNYTGNTMAYYTITTRKFSQDSNIMFQWTQDVENLVYNFMAQTPSFSVAYTAEGQNVTLIPNIDFSFSFVNNKNASTAESKAKLTIKGQGGYEGKFEQEFEIKRYSINNLLDGKTLTNRKAQEGVNYKDAILGEVAQHLVYRYTRLKEGVDYYCTYTSDQTEGEIFVDVGTITIVVQGINNFMGRAELVVSIVSKEINNFVLYVDGITYYNSAQVVYRGSAFSLSFDVRADDTVISSAGYAIKYFDNNNNEIDVDNLDLINANTFKIVATGVGNCVGNTTATISILPKNLNGTDVTIDNFVSEFVFNFGEPRVQSNIEVSYTTFNGTKLTLVEGQDFEIKYFNNAYVGQAVMQLIGTGNYCDLRNEIYYIIKRTSVVNPTFENIVYFVGDRLPILRLSSQDTNGALLWNDENTTLLLGTHEYSWIFHPNDSSNFTDVTGTIKVTAVKIVPLSIQFGGNFKTQYNAFDKFDTTGLIVYLVYNNGNKIVLDDTQYNLSISHGEELYLDSLPVVLYTDGESTVSGLVDITVLPIHLNVKFENVDNIVQKEKSQYITPTIENIVEGHAPSIITRYYSKSLNTYTDGITQNGEYVVSVSLVGKEYVIEGEASVEIYVKTGILKSTDGKVMLIDELGFEDGVRMTVREYTNTSQIENIIDTRSFNVKKCYEIQLWKNGKEYFSSHTIVVRFNVGRDILSSNKVIVYNIPSDTDIYYEREFEKIDMDNVELSTRVLGGFVFGEKVDTPSVTWWVGIVVGIVLLIAVLAVIFIVLNKRRRLKMISNGINIKLGRK